MTIQEIGYVMQALQLPLAVLIGIGLSRSMEFPQVLLISILFNICWVIAAFQLIHTSGVA